MIESNDAIKNSINTGSKGLDSSVGKVWDHSLITLVENN